MVSGIAKGMSIASGGVQVQVIDKLHRPRWHNIWKNLPFMAGSHPDRPTLKLVSGPGVRHYISRWEEWNGRPRAVWTDSTPACQHIGQINLSDEDRLTALEINKPFLVICPHGSSKGSVNRKWSMKRWQGVVDSFPNITWIQPVGPEYEPTLHNVIVMKTSFRQACGLIEKSDGLVSVDGGLAHAAGALGKNAVVLFGGWLSPSVTGYDFHANIYMHDPRWPLGCGRWGACLHCAEIMDGIEADKVCSEVRRMIDGVS